MANLICKFCGKKIKDELLTDHYLSEHPDYNFPEDWAKEGNKDG